jgi:hypothetical protein
LLYYFRVDLSVLLPSLSEEITQRAEPEIEPRTVLAENRTLTLSYATPL